MTNRETIRDQISAAAWKRYNELAAVGIKGLVPAECADIAMRVLDQAGLFTAQTATPAEVWYWSDDDEGSSPEVYLDVETAKAAAIGDLVAIDPEGFPEPAFTWRGYQPPGRDDTRWLLDYEDTFTGWSVDRIPVAASVVKAGA